jgi:hypothetical protein
MAEQEIIKHTEKAIKVLSKKNNSIWHKIKEALYEIAIIVFAVTLSIWFHNWSEHRQEQKQVKEFLLGLKKDIQLDVKVSKIAINLYKGFDTVYSYISKSNPAKLPGGDSVQNIMATQHSNITIHFHQSRFNGFLSAGKMNNIEDNNMQLDILNYYQYTIPDYLVKENALIANYKEYWKYCFENIKDINNNQEIWNVIASSKGRFYAKRLAGSEELYERLNNIIENGQSIIKQIDTLYPNQK